MGVRAVEVVGIGWWEGDLWVWEEPELGVWRAILSPCTASRGLSIFIYQVGGEESKGALRSCPDPQPAVFVLPPEDLHLRREGGYLYVCVGGLLHARGPLNLLCGCDPQDLEGGPERLQDHA